MREAGEVYVYDCLTFPRLPATPGMHPAEAGID